MIRRRRRIAHSDLKYLVFPDQMAFQTHPMCILYLIYN